MKTYRDLVVWQKAMKMVQDVYKLTNDFPKEEIYGLTAQIRRCSVSIPSNIAEGYGRKSTQDYLRFLKISSGSLYELQTQLEIAFNLSYMAKEAFDLIYETSREIERMMSSLIAKVEPKK
jgi:four helix bundle protein